MKPANGGRVTQNPARTHTTTREMIHDTILLHRTAVSPGRLWETRQWCGPIPVPGRLWWDAEAPGPLLRAVRWCPESL